MAITKRSVKGSALTHNELDENFNYLDSTRNSLTGVGWRDMLASVSSARVPPSNAPTATAFGSAGSLQRLEYAFAVGDYAFIQPFHVQHDIKPNSTAYCHVHWSTSGTSVNSVRWELNIQRSLGHGQANFGAPTQLLLDAQAAAGTALRHMITEDGVGITLYEPDELLLITLRRVTNGGTDNADSVFALEVDIHYQTDRLATLNRAPAFYV